jgi:hypothetical protein
MVLFSKVSVPAAGPTRPPILWLTAIFSGLKQPGCEANHFPPFSAEVSTMKNAICHQIGSNKIPTIINGIVKNSDIQKNPLKLSPNLNMLNLIGLSNAIMKFT